MSWNIEASDTETIEFRKVKPPLFDIGIEVFYSGNWIKL